MTILTLHTNTLDRLGLAPPKFKPGFFIDYRKGEVGELRLLLRKMAMDNDCTVTNSGLISRIVNHQHDGTVPSNIKRRRDILKRLIASMTLEIDLSRLYAEVVMVSHTNDPVQKKMIYLYLSTYSKDNPDLTILTINTLLKDVDSLDPVVRSLAVRNICAFGTKLSNDYAKMVCVKKMFDPCDNVKRTAIIGSIRLYNGDKSHDAIDGDYILTVRHLKSALNSTNASVMFDAMCALAEMSNQIIKLTRSTIISLINKMSQMNEWQQCCILQVMATYVPQGNELFDLMNLLDVKLKHASCAVFLATAKCFLIWTKHNLTLQNEVIKRLTSPIIALLSRSRPEICFTLLVNVLLLISNYEQGDAIESVLPFSKHCDVFFCRFDDPVYIKRIKINILLAIASESNAVEIIQELNEYVSDANCDIATQSIKALGIMAQEFPEHLDMVISLISTIFASNVMHVTSAVLYIIMGLLRIYPQHRLKLLNIVQGCTNVINDPESIANYIWILGEYAINEDHVPYTLEEFVNDQQLSDLVTNELLCACLKVYLVRAPEMYKALSKLLYNVLNDSSNPLLVDTAQFYFRLLKLDPAVATRIMLEQHPTENVNVMSKAEFFEPNPNWRDLFNTVELVEKYQSTYRPFFSFEYDQNATSDVFTLLEDSSEAEEMMDSTVGPLSIQENTVPVVSEYRIDDDLLAGFTPLNLVLPNTLLPEEFQNHWSEAQNASNCKCNIPHSSVNVDEIESILAQAQIITLASGKSGQATKFYQYAEDLYGVVYLIEMIFEPLIKQEDMELQVTVKSINGQLDNVQTFSDHLLRSIYNVLVVATQVTN